MSELSPAEVNQQIYESILNIKIEYYAKCKEITDEFLLRTLEIDGVKYNLEHGATDINDISIDFIRFLENTVIGCDGGIKHLNLLKGEM